MSIGRRVDLISSVMESFTLSIQCSIQKKGFWIKRIVMGFDSLGVRINLLLVCKLKWLGVFIYTMGKWRTSLLIPCFIIVPFISVKIAVLLMYLKILMINFISWYFVVIKSAFFFNNNCIFCASNLNHISRLFLVLLFSKVVKS